MTAKDKAFEAWMLSDLEAVASVIRARGEQNAEIVRTALRKAWDAGRYFERGCKVALICNEHDLADAQSESCDGKTSIPAIVFYPAGSLGEHVEIDGGEQ